MKNRLSFNNQKSVNDKNTSFGLSSGSSSILLIFVILCMVSFATLAIVSANADKKLSDKMLERTTQYYQACNTAEENLASLNTTLKRVYESSSNSDEYFNIAGTTKSYIVPISDTQSLQVCLDILYPTIEQGNLYRITSWQVINNENSLKE